MRIDKGDDWVAGTPVLEDGALPVGIEIEVNERGRIERYLVGHINALGGGCDDCPVIELNNPNYRIVRWRRVWSPADGGRVDQDATLAAEMDEDLDRVRAGQDVQPDAINHRQAADQAEHTAAFEAADEEAQRRHLAIAHRAAMDVEQELELLRRDCPDQYKDREPTLADIHLWWEQRQSLTYGGER